MNQKSFDMALDTCGNGDQIKHLIWMEESDGELDLPKLAAAVKRLAEMVRDMQP